MAYPAPYRESEARSPSDGLSSPLSSIRFLMSLMKERPAADPSAIRRAAADGGVAVGRARGVGAMVTMTDVVLAASSTLASCAVMISMISNGESADHDNRPQFLVCWENAQVSTGI